MTHSTPSFASEIVMLILAPLLVVATTAFVSIPWSIGGHPGDVASVSATAYHPT